MAPQDEPSFRQHVCEELVQGLRDMGIYAPNSIQADAIPLALSGRDVMVIAQTGSGKTLTFLLPILQRLSESKAFPTQIPDDAVHPEAVVVAPTEDLAAQVASVAERLISGLPEPFAVHCAARSVCLSTGAARARLLVVTPESLSHNLRQRRIMTGRLRFVSIDETDAVLCEASGAAHHADRLLSALEEARSDFQLFLTMAHLSDADERELLQRFPHVQQVRHTGVLVPTLRECFHYISGDRDGKLLKVLRDATDDPWLSEGTTMVFCSTLEDAPRLRALIEEADPSAKPHVLHDGLGAEERASVRNAFSSGESRLLVATDVAARGLDFPLLRHVVLYDMPSDVTTFVHCAGRTARKGQSGLVTCLVQGNHFGFRNHHALEAAAQLDFKAEDDSRPRSGTARQTKERRVDPEDGNAYTLAELLKYYVGLQYAEPDILQYWETQCYTPAPTRRRRAARASP